MEMFFCPYCEKKVFGSDLIAKHKAVCNPLPPLPEFQEVYSNLGELPDGKKIRFSVQKRTFSDEFPKKRYERQLNQEIPAEKVVISDEDSEYAIEFADGENTMNRIITWVDDKADNSAEFSAVTISGEAGNPCLRFQKDAKDEHTLKRISYIQLDFFQANRPVRISCGYTVELSPASPVTDISKNLQIKIDVNVCLRSWNLSFFYDKDQVIFDYESTHAYTGNTGTKTHQTSGQKVYFLNDMEFCEFLISGNRLYFQEFPDEGPRLVFSSDKDSQSCLGHHSLWMSERYSLELDVSTLHGKLDVYYSQDLST